MAPLRQGPRHLTVKVNGVMWLLFGMLLFGDPHTYKHTVVDVNCRGTLRSNHSRYFSLKLGFTERLTPAHLPPVL